MSLNSNNDPMFLEPWKLIYEGFSPDLEKSRESLLAVGNGYLGSRGAMEECLAGETHYPGTYLAGLYNRLVSKVGDRDIENEDLVNCPNWHFIRFRIDGGNWVNINSESIVSVRRELNLKTGILYRNMVVRDDSGKETIINSKRTASMDNPHLLLMKYNLQAGNYSGVIEIESILDGDIINDGVVRYRQLNQKHLGLVEEGFSDDVSWIMVKTTQSNIEIAEANRSRAYLNGNEKKGSAKYVADKGVSRTIFKFHLEKGDNLTIDNTGAIYTSKPDDSEDPLFEAQRDVRNSDSLDLLFDKSAVKWREIWDKMDIVIEGDIKSQLLIRLHLYHLIVTASPHNIHIDAGIPARGLHGEAYRGHIFWDELYILPIYNLFFPEIAKSVLKYRYKRLDKARDYSREYGFKGAMFPWQSGSDGREETQILHLNPISGKWGEDYSSLQRHISIAVAYNVWYYYHITEDQLFMDEYGAELFFEICRFWASKAQENTENGRYSISMVMGPDEFHELHPLSPEGGVKDNAYTNIMVAWLFNQAGRFWGLLSDDKKNVLESTIGINKEEIEYWQRIAANLYLNISDDSVLAQFHGYFDLAELDWDYYRKKYKNIYRLDRILKAEGKSPDDYKLAKQADTLMTFYNLDDSLIRNLVEKMGYNLDSEALRKNYDYYVQRTSHGSTLSRVVHAYLANQMGDYDLGWQLYSEALESDYTDIQGGTTAEGIHAGVMGGTVLMAITSYLGVNFKMELLHIDPHLPDKWESIRISFFYKKCQYRISCTHKNIEIEPLSGEKVSVSIILRGKKIVLQTNYSTTLEY